MNVKTKEQKKQVITQNSAKKLFIESRNRKKSF